MPHIITAPSSLKDLSLVPIASCHFRITFCEIESQLLNFNALATCCSRLMVDYPRKRESVLCTSLYFSFKCLLWVQVQPLSKYLFSPVTFQVLPKFSKHTNSVKWGGTTCCMVTPHSIQNRVSMSLRVGLSWKNSTTVPSMSPPATQNLLHENKTT